MQTISSQITPSSIPTALNPSIVGKPSHTVQAFKIVHIPAQSVETPAPISILEGRRRRQARRLTR